MAAWGQPASRALRSKGSAEPQLAAATDASSGGRGAPIVVAARAAVGCAGEEFRANLHRPLATLCCIH
jgi:hypothetical protein